MRARQFPVRHDVRLVPAAIAVWLGAIWAIGAEANRAGSAAAIAGGGALIVIAGLLWARQAYPLNAQIWQRATLIGALALVLLCAVLVIIAAAHHRWENSTLFIAQKAEGHVQLTGRITTDVTRIRGKITQPWQGERWRATMSTVHIQYRGETHQEGARITLIGSSELATAQAGQMITISGTLRPTDPGDATRAILFTSKAPELQGDPTGVYGWGGEIRARFSGAAKSLPAAARGLVPGMVVGDTAQISDEIDQAMRDTSLTHLTAVSGAHCTLIIGAALAICRPPRSWTLRRRRLARAGAAGAILAGFMIATGPQPSVLRAGVMGAIGLLGLMRGHHSRAVSALAVAVVVLLLIDPWLARNYGFCLSVLSTAAIVLVAGPLGQWCERWLPKPLATALAVSASAQVACLPLLLAIDPRLTLYSLPANVLVAPLFPFVSLPGAAGLVLTLLVPPLAPALLWIAALPAQGIAFIAQIFSGLPAATVPWPPSPGTWWALGALTIAAVLAVWFRAEVRARRRYFLTWGSSALALVVFVTCTGPGQSLRELAGWQDPHRNWFAAQCDVGQGDALVIRSQPGAIIMIDVGLPGPAARDCLQELGIEKVDLLVLTHWHLDHVGGLEDVLAYAQVHQVVTPAWEEPRTTAQPALAMLGGSKWASVDSGSVAAAFTLPGVEGKYVWPTHRAVELMPSGADDGTSVNDLSTVVLLEIETPGGPVSLLALGDVEEAGQRGVLRQLRTMGSNQVDVLKMAHHGSSRQSEGLAELTDPRAVLIGVGAENDYGHPAVSAWNLYAERGALIGSTDRHGRVTLIAEHSGEIKMLTQTGSSS